MSNPVPEPSKKRAGGKAMKWNRAARNVRKCFVVFQCQTFITDPIQFARDLTNVWLANCYFSQDSSGFSVDRKSTRLNSSHGYISYAVFCLKKTTQMQPYT